MKKFILPALIILIIIALFIVINTVDFGALTISIIERTADIDIEYRNMQGSILSGYRIDDYNVRLSETDSIYGERADIHYRLRPLVFRLPNLFEINLVEPTVHIKKKPSTGEQRKIALPRFTFGLRMNVKNGLLIFEDEKPYTIEGISGLVFVDLIASKIYLGTMNLSFRSKEFPISVTSANLDLRIDSRSIKARSLQIKGDGLILQGKGTYFFDNNQASFEFEKAQINIQKFSTHRGTITFSGEVEYNNNKLLPKIQGTAIGLAPFDYFNFETNIFADTVLINMFDGELLGGNLFAQVKFVDLKNWDFEANFHDLDIGKTIDSKEPLLISGFVGYRGKNFIGFVQSPTEYGLDIDSLLIFGSTVNSKILLDSLFVIEDKKTLKINGLISSKYDLNIEFDDFNIKRFSKYIPLQDTLFKADGKLKGSCHIQGDFKKIENILFTSDIIGHNFKIMNLSAKKISLKCRNFQPSVQSEYLELTLNEVAYDKYSLKKVTLSLDNHNILFKVRDKSKSNILTVEGVCKTAWCGTITSFYCLYNGVETVNSAPITFDIPHKELGEINLTFIDGALHGSLSPLSFNLSNGDLSKLGKILSLKEEISGKIDISFEENVFSINARDIIFMEINNGIFTAKGEYKNKTIMLESLDISDENNQSLHLGGLFSKENSDIHLKFSNVGLWALPFLNDVLESPDGIISGDISFQGNAENFEFNGTGELTNGSFDIAVISAKIDSIKIKIAFRDNKIIFERADGKVFTTSRSRLSRSDGAEVSAGGKITFAPRFIVEKFNFDFSFKDAPILYLPFAYGVGSGNFSVGGSETETYYNGAVTLKQAVVPIDFGLEIKEEEEDIENWIMNLKIRGERNIWLRNREADIEFGGELYIIKRDGPVYLSGNLESRRGNFYWLNHVLSITHGQVTFMPEDKIDAELNFWAEMNTRDRHPDTGEEIKIKLHCFGPMSEPIFEFFSEPPYYSEQDIITYLNLNITWREIESMKQGEYVGKVLPASVISWLEGDVSRRIRQYTGLDYFRIETPLFEPDSKTKLTVGKYISKDLFITYTYDITSFQNEFNVEYFIDDKNEILVRRDEEGEYSLQYQYRIRF